LLKSKDEFSAGLKEGLSNCLSYLSPDTQRLVLRNNKRSKA
jgi:hypothetical protein